MEQQKDIFNRIEECIKKITLGKIDTINYFDRIEQDLGIDSMGVTELVFTLEDIFKIEISDDDLSENINVQDIIELIIKKNVSEVNLKTAMQIGYEQGSMVTKNKENNLDSLVRS